MSFCHSHKVQRVWFPLGYELGQVRHAVTPDLETVFGVSLTEDDWLEIVQDGGCSAGDLFTLVRTRRMQTEASRTSFKNNALLWRKVQQLIAEVCHVPVDGLTLSTPLGEVFPTSSRSLDFRTLEVQTQWRWPPLRWPDGLLPSLFAFSVLLMCFFAARIQSAQLHAVLPAICILLHLLVIQLLRDRRVSLPQDMNTLKDLCRWLRDANLGRLSRDESFSFPSAEPNNEADVEEWNQFSHCIADALGIDESEVAFDTRLDEIGWEI